MEYKKTAVDFSLHCGLFVCFCVGKFRRGAAGDTFISIPVFLRIFRAVSAGYFALGGKVTKTPPGMPRTPLYPIGHKQWRGPVATEIPLAPRNRCGGRLTSPDGPRDEGFGRFLLSGVSRFSIDAGSSSQKIDESLPSKGRQPKSDETPGGDQMPGGFCDSVAP